MNKKTFLKRNGIEGAKQIAKAYASGNYSIREISRKFDLTDYAVRQILDDCIVFGIVSYEMAKAMQQVSHSRQVVHYDKENSKTKSDLYYEDLFSKRFAHLERIRKQIVLIEHKIDFLENQILTYEEFQSELESLKLPE